MSSLEREIVEAINRNSAEKGSDTPDFILGRYLMVCLAAFEQASNAREKWYGRETARGPFPAPTRTDGAAAKPSPATTTKPKYACSRCNDTHVMALEARDVMCTHCPVPCQKCRQGGNGPYCEKTPCACACHDGAAT